jgi:aryl-alcohol dehydrogenase
VLEWEMVLWKEADGCVAMLNVAHPETKESVAVIGAGSVGLAALMAVNIASKRPKQVIAVDILPSRLDLAKSLGATHTINSKETPDLKAEIMKATDGAGVEAAIDTTGRPDILKTLLNSVAKKGMVVTVGVGKITDEVSISIFDTVNSGRTYVGCVMGNCYPQEFIPMLINAWNEGNFPIDRLVTTYDAKNMEEAKQDTLSGKAVKAVLKW